MGKYFLFLLQCDGTSSSCATRGFLLGQIALGFKQSCESKLRTIEQPLVAEF